jgi:transcriptional regulator with XRE-family HTH domain
MHISAHTIAKQLRSFVTKKRLTQQALEKETGVPQSQISRAMRAEFHRISPNIETLCKFAGIDLTGDARGKAPLLDITAIINGIVQGSRHRERLLIKLLKTGALLAGPHVHSERRGRKRTHSKA